MNKKVCQILTKDNICRKCYAEDKYDEICDPQHYSAVRFTLSGALIRCYPKPKKRFEILARIKKYLFKTHRFSGTIWQWADSAPIYEILDMLKWEDI